MKRFISLLLSVIMMVTMMPVVMAQTSSEADVSADEKYEPTWEEYLASHPDYEAEENEALAIENASLMVENTASGIVRYTVLALDTSGSMSGTPMTCAKEAAIKFCEDIIAAGGTNYLALVSLNSSASVKCNFTTDINTIKTAINNLYASGGTNVNDALIKAKSLLDNVTAENVIKNVVVLSDGLPQSGTTSTSGPYTSSDYSSYKYANAAYNTAVSMWDTCFIYTLGFFHDLSGSTRDFGERFMNDLQNKGAYIVDDPEDLVFVFGDIADQITEDNANCPIVLVPDFMQSELYTDDACTDKIWEPEEDTDTWSSVTPFTSFNDKMDYSNDLCVADSNVNQSLEASREYGVNDIYKTLVDELCAAYPEREIYYFSYDFRDSSADTAVRLSDLITAVTDEKWTKVDLICHGFGGLVASSYVDQLGSDKIKNVISVATPFEGSPAILNTVFYRDVLTDNYNFDGWFDSLEKLLCEDALNGLKGLNKEVKASFPSLAELSPTEQLFEEFEFTRGERRNPDRTPMSYNEYQQLLDTVFDGAYSSAESFHDGIKDANGLNVLASLENSYFVAGINQSTIGGLTFNHQDTLAALQVVDLTFDFEGDGLVPYASASMNGALNALGDRYIEIDDTHNGLLENIKTISWIKEILSTQEIQTEKDDKDYTGKLVVRIACPVEFEIERGTEKLSSSFDDAGFRTSFGEVYFVGEDLDIKIVCLKDDDVDDIKLTGTDNGSMNLSFEWLDEQANVLDQRAFNDVPLTPETIINTNTDNTRATVLSVDDNGDGNVDSNVMADANSVVNPSTDAFATIHIAATKNRVRIDRDFTYTVSLSGSYDGYSFKLPEFDDITVTNVEPANDQIYVDEKDGGWLVSVIGGCEKADAEKEVVVTVTAHVDANAQLGERVLSIPFAAVSNEEGDKITKVLFDCATILVTKRLPGDINGDDVFNYYDVSKLFAYYRGKTTIEEDVDPDINGDGTFNYYDVSKLFAIYRGKASFDD